MLICWKKLLKKNREMKHKLDEFWSSGEDEEKMNEKMFRTSCGKRKYASNKKPPLPPLNWLCACKVRRGMKITSVPKQGTEMTLMTVMMMLPCWMERLYFKSKKKSRGHRNAISTPSPPAITRRTGGDTSIPEWCNTSSTKAPRSAQYASKHCGHSCPLLPTPKRPKSQHDQRAKVMRSQNKSQNYDDVAEITEGEDTAAPATLATLTDQRIKDKTSESVKMPPL